MREIKLLSKKEVCEILGIKPSTLDKLLGQKKIRTVRFNRRVLFDLKDIQNFIEEHKD